jgi:hypothetical protein
MSRNTHPKVQSPKDEKNMSPLYFLKKKKLTKKKKKQNNKHGSIPSLKNIMDCERNAKNKMITNNLG